MARCDVHPTSESGIARGAGSEVLPLVLWNSLDLPAHLGVVDEVDRLDRGMGSLLAALLPGTFERSNVPTLKRKRLQGRGIRRSRPGAMEALGCRR